MIWAFVLLCNGINNHWSNWHKVKFLIYFPLLLYNIQKKYPWSYKIPWKYFHFHFFYNMTFNLHISKTIKQNRVSIISGYSWNNINFKENIQIWILNLLFNLMWWIQICVGVWILQYIKKNSLVICIFQETISTSIDFTMWNSIFTLKKI